MITGRVTSDGSEAILPLEVGSPDGDAGAIEAVVDTGFDGFLTLPPRIVRALRLPQTGSIRAILGDGTVRDVDTFEAVVMWNNERRGIEVEQAETTPLVGMSLLAGCGLWIECEANGVVEVSALPR